MGSRIIEGIEQNKNIWSCQAEISTRERAAVIRLISELPLMKPASWVRGWLAREGAIRFRLLN
jgi:hypothetical protein